ncbi:hypothetical protein DFH29DRAFT_997923 [Suillus ampliporus]|nr:hypothetical protein DFH29DRAFT_997923 [Suillus ampliporus]
MPSTAASRRFIDLIRQASSKWANLDPPIEIKVGDYGKIDNDTGELEIEGNIYDNSFQTSLNNQGLKINLSDSSYQPKKGPIGDNMIISSSGVKQGDLTLKPEVSFLNLASASVKAEFEFQGDKRGAVLVMYKPQQEYISPGKVLTSVLKADELQDKYLVTSTFTCPGYYLYLSNKSGERVALALTAGVPIPAPIGVSAGGEASVDWWTDAQGAFLRKAFDKAGQYRYTPLYDLKYRSNGWPKVFGRARNQSARVPPVTFGYDTQMHHYETTEHTGDHDSPNNYPSETDEASGSDDLLLDIFAINTTVRNASIAGDLHTAEDLLTQEIDTDDNNYASYANRSVVRARNSEWDNALQDADKSITIQPSLLGYISKGIALCGNELPWDAMEAFDLASIFLNRDPITIDILLLIKAVTLFNAGRRDEAMQRVQDLATACQHLDTLPCSVVNLYLRVQLAIISFADGRYSEAADQLNDNIPSITNLFSRRTLFEPRWKIFTVLFGWDLDSLWQTANQMRCDAFLRADRVIEAIKSHQYMMRKTASSNGALSHSVFKKNCITRCVAKGDEAIAASNYETAIELYSVGIGLDSSSESLFTRRSKANLERNLYAEALHDADKVIELNASSYVGYELKHTALHGAQRYDEAIAAFKIVPSKLDDTSDAQIQKLRHKYVSPSEVEDAIRQVIHTQLDNAPLRLLNTSTGRLCNRDAQINAFMESVEYREILSSSMTHAPLQTDPIEEAVAKYFSWVMLSHRWGSKEPLLHDIQDKVVYDLDPVGAVVKLQNFCKVARDKGYLWAWSDTCCIDQNSNVELQRSVNSMFIWYRHSALTIVYLSDVPPSAHSGALANSAWNTRGWTVQEFLAPAVILFYHADWTPYLEDRFQNHKESVTILQELEDSTGIDMQSLVAFEPGTRGVRQKLQWASTRVTTLQEDIAYSLFGIFGVYLPVIYGEMKQNALGRLLQEIIARSGDTTALDWVGKSSNFNSCLPADITSYKAPPCMPPYPTEDVMQTSLSSLRHAMVVESALKLYTLLDNLGPPRFATSRLQLPCIAFAVTEVRRKRDQNRATCSTYEVKAGGLDDLLITTKDKLVQFSPARHTRQTLLLVRPWNRHDLGLPDLTDDRDAQSMYGSLLDEPLDGHRGEDELVDQSRELRLIVHLGQPFGALFLAQQHGGEYKRIASGHNIMARVKDMTAVHDMMDVRTLEIL